jgi:iron complex transport system permease protein
VVVTALMIGTGYLGVADVLATLVGRGSVKAQFILYEVRMPETIGGLVVGMALGVAGALTQTFARNPLATPDIIGVTSGASVGAVAAIVLAGGSESVVATTLQVGIPGVAIVSGLISATLIYVLALRGGVDSFRLVLVGIGATAIFTGITQYLIARAQLSIASHAQQWLVGSLSAVSWDSIWPVVVALVVCVPLGLGQGRAFDAMALGDDAAQGLGVHLGRHRTVVLGCAVVLTAVAVSAAGPIEFVAFVAPQIVRMIAGASRPPLLASGLMGGILVVVAHTIGRSAFDSPVPVGIITAIIGAPYLLWLIARPRRQEA